MDFKNKLKNFLDIESGVWAFNLIIKDGISIEIGLGWCVVIGIVCLFF